MNHSLVRLDLALLVALVAGGTAVGQDGAEVEFDAEAFRDAAERYTLATASEPDAPFELVPKPILTWSNPERQTPSGAVFLYTRDGRPQVALCVYPNQGRLDHEFQSLASEPLRGQRDGALVWVPRTAGIEIKPVEGASPPGSTPVRRLREMRNLSRQFDAAITKPNAAGIPLRLLSTPLYRYPPDELPAGVVDGAVFAFVQSTDPEVLLILEARENAAGEARWYAGLARMSMVPLSVRVDGEEVWSTDWATQNPTTTYYTTQAK